MIFFQKEVDLMVVIKELKTMEELVMVHEIEQQIWRQDPIPLHQTFTAVKNGGIMLAAFENGAVIGFSYGFTGFKDKETYLCSHMLGIEPLHRSRKIGEQLKWRQREIALRKGYDLIKWTFDPLETRNAYLNLTKLNGICNTYIENCYGEMKDDINNGLPSDRFEVYWHLKSPHVAKRKSLDMNGMVALNATEKNRAGHLTYKDKDTVEPGADVYSLAVPKQFQQLKAEDPELAMEWRMKTREKFQSLFEAGYSAVHLNSYDNYAEYIFMRTEKLSPG